MPQEPQLRRLDDALLDDLGIGHFDDELLADLGIERQPSGFGPRLVAGLERDFSKVTDALFPPPPPPTLQHLPPGAVGPPRQVAAEAVGIAQRAGKLVGDLFRPGGERRSGFREASRQALLTGDTGPTQELIGGGVQEALKLGAQFTGGPQTAERIGRVAADPLAALGRFADSPILGSILPVADVALLGGAKTMLNRSLQQAVRPEVQAVEATARAAEAQKLLTEGKFAGMAADPAGDLAAATARQAAEEAAAASVTRQATGLVDDIAARARQPALTEGTGLVGAEARVTGAGPRPTAEVLDEGAALVAERQAVAAQQAGLPTTVKVVNEELAALDLQIEAIGEELLGSFGPKFVSEGLASPAGARAVAPELVQRGGGFQLGRTPQPAAELPQVAAVSRVQANLDALVKKTGMLPDTYRQHLMGVTGTSRLPSSLAEVQAVLRSVRRSVETGAPPPAGPEIRAAIKRLRGRGQAPPPEVTSPRPAVPAGELPAKAPPPATVGRLDAPRTRQTLAGDVPVVTSTMPELLQKAAPADAVFEGDMAFMMIANSGERARQAVREWVDFGIKWTDFDYLSRGAGTSLRSSTRGMKRALETSVSRAAPAFKWMGKSVERNVAVARALLANSPTGNAAVDRAYLLIKDELRLMHRVEATATVERGQRMMAAAANKAEQGAAVKMMEQGNAMLQQEFSFVEGYVPIIRRLQEYGGLQQVPRDIHRYAALKIINPHRKLGPDAAKRAAEVERMLSDKGVRVEDLVQLRLYMGHRDVYLNPTIERLVEIHKASQALTSRGLTTFEAAAEKLPSLGPTTQKKISSAVSTLQRHGEVAPWTMVQQDSVSLYLPKFTGGAGFLDVSSRFNNFVLSRFGYQSGPSRVASTLTRNTLTSLLGFQTKTAVKQISQLQNLIIDRGWAPAGFGLFMGTVGEPVARGTGAVLRRLGSTGPRSLGRSLGAVRAPRGRLGSIRGEIETLQMRQLESRLLRAYMKGAFFQLEQAENYVRGVSFWAGKASNRIRLAARTAESTSRGGQVTDLGQLGVKGAQRYTRMGAAREGIKTAIESQFHYGVAAESPLFAAMGGIGTMANGLTTFTRKQAQFFARQLVERPVVQVARSGKAIKGALKGEVTSGRLAHELLVRTPQEFMPLARFFFVWGAMDRMAEKLGLNFDDITGYMPVTSAFRFGSPFAVFEPFLAMGKVMQTQEFIDDRSTDLDRAQALVEFVEASMRFTGLPVAAVETWAQWWRQTEVGFDEQIPEADPKNILAPQNIPVLRRLQHGGSPQGPMTLTESTLEALVAEPSRVRDMRAEMSAMEEARSEVGSLREQAVIDMRAAVLLGLAENDTEAVVSGLSGLQALGLNIKRVFAPPDIKKLEALSDIEEIWYYMMRMQEEQ